MHAQTFKTEVLLLTSKQFSNSIDELKDKLDFKVILSDDFLTDLKKDKFGIILIEDEILNHKGLLPKLNNLKNTAKIGIFDKNNFKELMLDEILTKPIKVNELNKKVINLIAGKKYLENSSLRIKNYILDKNEKKFKNDDKFITVTEKEIQLIELLFSEKLPVSRSKILETIWHYSAEADTHTVETHIYRLRKKILEKFNDNNLINNSKKGYSI